MGTDPIFLGAEGMSGLEHALIGSVSEAVNAIPTGENRPSDETGPLTPFPS